MAIWQSAAFKRQIKKLLNLFLFTVAPSAFVSSVKKCVCRTHDGLLYTVTNINFSHISLEQSPTTGSLKGNKQMLNLLFLLLQLLLIVLLNLYRALTQFCYWLGGYNLLAKDWHSQTSQTLQNSKKIKLLCSSESRATPDLTELPAACETSCLHMSRKIADLISTPWCNYSFTELRNWLMYMRVGFKMFIQ